MIIKYRVHEVAKDFGKQSKAVVDILAKHFPDDPKKHMTALEDKELDVVFETLTQENQVANFDEYFASANKEKEAPAEKEEAPKAEKKPAKKDASKAKDSEKAPKRQLQREIRLKKLPRAKNQKAPRKLRRLNPKSPRIIRKIKKRIKLQSPCSQELRAICAELTQEADRLSLINTTRDMKNIAPAVHGQSDRQTNKQKLKQKSQQYRKQGMRSHKRETEAERLKRNRRRACKEASACNYSTRRAYSR